MRIAQRIVREMSSSSANAFQTRRTRDGGKLATGRHARRHQRFRGETSARVDAQDEQGALDIIGNCSQLYNLNLSCALF